MPSSETPPDKPVRPRHRRKAAAGLELCTVDRVLALVLDHAAREPSQTQPRRLVSLFRDLAKPKPSRDPDEIEEMIWALWISHDEPEAASAMVAACEAMSDGETELAVPLLERLCESHPGWSEAWNKRATAAFILEDDGRAVACIERALALEPRHFGAVSGFAQICARNGLSREALAAFTVALALNPHLQGVKGMMEDLSAGLVASPRAQRLN